MGDIVRHIYFEPIIGQFACYSYSILVKTGVQDTGRESCTYYTLNLLDLTTIICGVTSISSIPRYSPRDMTSLPVTPYHMETPN